MKHFYFIWLFFFTFASYGQNPKLDSLPSNLEKSVRIQLGVGGIVPLGAKVSNTYSMGLGLDIGFTFNINKWAFGPYGAYGAYGKDISNSGNSLIETTRISILGVGIYRIIPFPKFDKKLIIGPQIAVSSINNYLTTNQNNSSNDKLMIMSGDGVLIGINTQFVISELFSIGVEWNHLPSNLTISNDILFNYKSNGLIIEPEQKFDMSFIAFKIILGAQFPISN